MINCGEVVHGQACGAKHLCGSGTDLALKSLQTIPTGNIDGCVMATCCHGLCEWSDYTGRDCLLRLFCGGGESWQKGVGGGHQRHFEGRRRARRRGKGQCDNRRGKRHGIPLWGKPAQTKVQTVLSKYRNKNHAVIACSHPSPLGATKTNAPFLGSGCFSRANEELRKRGWEEVDWRVDGDLSNGI